MDEPGLFHRALNFAIKLASRDVYEETLRVTARVRASDLDWTLVRVPMLTDDPPKGEIKVGYLGKGAGTRISRADMATFILKQVDDDTYVRRAPVISN